MNTILNILTLGIKPLYEKQFKFHKLISDFRDRLANYQKAEVTEAEVMEFYEKLNKLDFSFVFFAKYYRSYISHVNRFKPEGEDLVLELSLLNIAIAEDKWKPTEPYPIFIYHLRYKSRFFSKYFISYQKKQNRKKLDAPGTLAKQNNKLKSAQKWTRVPLSKDHSQ